MGVPSLFQWVFYRYPKAVKAVYKQLPPDVPPGDAQPRIDCLFFDLNSVIHNCCHGNDPLPEDATEDDMVLRIFEQVDDIISFVKPQKLVYFAVDGVVPCGKLLQQRARRLRTAEEQLRAPAAKKQGDFDVNSISPGTQFMAKIAKALEWYIHDRASNNEELKQLAFILSDASVAGEGEHKIVEYIQHLMAEEAYDPNTYHCICSQDADLVLLSLLLHNPHVSLLREYQDQRPPRGQRPRPRHAKALKYDYLHIATVREYLAADFSRLLEKKEADFERVIDDFVFLVGLMGNDFLPSLPSLQVREGALDELVVLYGRTFAGHLVEDEGKTVRFDRLVPYLQYYSKKEPIVLAERVRSALQRDPHWQEKETFNFLRADYREAYAQEKLRGRELQVCADYLQGLKWCTDYYFTGNASWTWVYPHSLPPLVSALADHCVGFRGSSQHVYRGPPLRPVELLLAILPRMNNTMLPECFRELAKEGGKLGDMFETEHVTERIGGRTLTVTKAIDVRRLVKTVRSPAVAKLMPEEHRELNTFGLTLAFFNADVHDIKAPAKGEKRSAETAYQGEKGERVESSCAALCLTGIAREPEGAVPQGGEYRLTWALLDPVQNVRTRVVVLENACVHPHRVTPPKGLIPTPARLTATESLMGAASAYQHLVPPMLPPA